MDKTIPYVDYYSENNISPVSQDIKNIEIHYERRTSLYKDLGIPPVLFRKSSVLEIGPGSGYNSIHIAQFKPPKYVLIEPNKTGREKITELFSTHCKNYKNYSVINTLIQDWKADDLFDIVIGEGFLALLHNASQTLKIMGSYVSHGGILCASTADDVSMLGDMLKRLIGLLLVNPSESLNDQLNHITKVYDKLLNIEGRSRPIKDWVLDMVLYPMDKTPNFSIKEAIIALNEDFVFYNSSSPNFKTDYRWYKQQVNQGDAFNQIAIQQYSENIHNLLDYRVTYAPRPAQDNEALDTICQKIANDIVKFGKNRDLSLLEVIIKNLQTLISSFDLDKNTIQALTDCCTAIDQIVNKNKDIEFGQFCDFSGRGQQYVSFLKKDKPFIR